MEVSGTIYGTAVYGWMSWEPRRLHDQVLQTKHRFLLRVIAYRRAQGTYGPPSPYEYDSMQRHSARLGTNQCIEANIRQRKAASIRGSSG